MAFTPPASFPFRLPTVPDPILDGLTPAADAPERGMWLPPSQWPLVAIHAALLPDGRVVSFGSPTGGTAQAGRIFDIWDPVAGQGDEAHWQSPNAVGVDSFCASAAWIGPGRLMVAGGNSERATSILDPDSRVSSNAATLAAGRWYGTMLTLADGRALMVGGSAAYADGGYINASAYLNADGSSDLIAMTPEVYSPQSGWRQLSGATSRDAFGPDYNRYWYPRAWVAGDGSVVGLSAQTLWRLDADANSGAGSIEVTGTFKSPVDELARPNVGVTASAVMFDRGRVLQVGGNGYHNGDTSAADSTISYRTSSSKQATIIDFGDPSRPSIRETASMHHPRQWHNVTVLPDGQVFVSGGTRYANYGGDDAVRNGEIWNPDTGTWRETAAASRIRVYHSTALLLPNGTVLTAGGGVPGPVLNLDAEVFVPPGLFARDAGGAVRLAKRPVLESASTLTPGYGTHMQLALAGSSTIRRIALIGLGNVTHSFDSGQRRQTLSFTQRGAVLDVELPARAALAPPGYYMLTALDASDVPSRAVIIRLGFGV
ncbi:MAG: DUF1929 domain-containing protein [Burkholderiaceae bacterium]